MVLPKEAGIKATRLGQLGFGNDLVHTAVQMLAVWRVGNRAIEAKLHVFPPVSVLLLFPATCAQLCPEIASQPVHGMSIEVSARRMRQVRVDV